MKKVKKMSLRLRPLVILLCLGSISLNSCRYTTKDPVSPAGVKMGSGSQPGSLSGAVNPNTAPGSSSVPQGVTPANSGTELTAVANLGFALSGTNGSVEQMALQQDEEQRIIDLVY